ncbi:hypothetical protein, partial [Escherichia coli]|uniref:hypothetical protein n=1 Tax=Escherichia coli TaxID=562 RepID=UPI001BC85D96
PSLVYNQQTGSCNVEAFHHVKKDHPCNGAQWVLDACEDLVQVGRTVLRHAYSPPESPRPSQWRDE